MERPESIETALDEAIDALVAGDPEAARRVQERHGDAPELTQLMEAAGEVRGALAATAPSAEAQSRHLRMIREAADRLAQEPKPVPAPGPRRFRRFVFRPALVFGILLLLAAPAALALSARALPGDALYSTKIAVEHVRLAMARDPAKQVGLHVEFAQRRVEELAKLSDAGLPSQRAIAPVLSDLKAHQKEAADGVVAMRQEGRTVGPLEERLAVSLQQSTEKLSAIRSDTGCAPGDADARCNVISIAVTQTEQTLRTVDEGPTGTLPGTLPDPTTGPGTGEGSQAPPAGPDAGQPTTEPPAGGGVQPGTGEGQPGTGDPSSPPSGSGGQEPGGQPSDPSQAPGDPTTSPPDSIQGGTVQPVQVQIDIKPLDDTNTLDVARRRDVPVVVRGSADFDAGALDLTTVCFGDDPTDPANADCTVGASRAVDLNRDGYMDVVLMFQVPETGIDVGDTEACLAGRTTDGHTVRGCDKLSVLGPAPSGAPSEAPARLPEPAPAPEGGPGATAS